MSWFNDPNYPHNSEYILWWMDLQENNSKNLIKALEFILNYLNYIDKNKISSTTMWKINAFSNVLNTFYYNYISKNSWTIFWHFWEKNNLWDLLNLIDKVIYKISEKSEFTVKDETAYNNFIDECKKFFNYLKENSTINHLKVWVANNVDWIILNNDKKVI